MDKRKRRLLCMLEGSGRKSRWISGAPPLSFRAFAAGTLENYRIYGNTVDGASVGDKTKNLFSANWIHGSYDVGNGNYSYASNCVCTDTLIPVKPGTTYAMSRTLADQYIQVRGYDKNKKYVGGGLTVVSPKDNPMNIGIPFCTFTVNSDIFYLHFNDLSNRLDTKYMMVVNNGYTDKTMPAYEPYGYRVPVTINDVTTNLYLPEPLKMVGDDAEYVDFVEQKQYFADGTSVDVELPALPTIAGANVLTVGTAVQPSKIEVKGKIKAL